MTQSSDRDPDRSIFKKEVLGDGRLAALRRYDILDTPPEESFDRLTELAGAAFDVEVAFLAFLTSDRQWFKSSVGLDRTESSLAASFCTYTVEREDLFVIEDAREEERMAQSPFVTEVGLRFYAGVPVMTPDGYAIGTFSIMDSEPQSLSDKKKQRLRSLAQMATEELERRREAQEQKQIARRFTAVFEDPNVCGAVLSPDGTLTEINETFLNRVSEDREKVIGRPFWTLSWWSDERQEDVRTWIRRASTRDYIDFEADVTGPSGACYNVEGTIRPVTDDDETVTSLVVSARDVTARREHERELRLFKSAVEQAGESILITEAEPIEKPGPRIEYVNAAFEDMTGYREEEIRSKTPRILQGPETNRTVLDGLRAALEAGVSWEGETTNYRKDGTPYIVRWSISPVRGGGDQIEHWVSVQQDVTEKRTREEALRHQRNLLEQAQRLAGAWEVDLRSEKVTCSKKVFDILEVSSETELDLEDVLQFYPPEARSALQDALRRCVDEGTPYDVELPLITAKGTRRWIRTVGAPAERQEGRVVKVAGAFQDITQQKNYQRQLERYRDYTGDILDAVDDIFYILDASGHLERWNESLPEVTGYTDEEISEMHGTDFFPERHAGKIAAAIEEVFDTGDTVVEAPFLTKDGELIPHEFIASLVEDPDGNLKLAGIGRDVTERKQREQSLIRAKKTAEEASRLKSAMLANMSHEIRTPLTSVTGFADLLQSTLKGENRRFAGRIYESGRRLQKTLDSVLQLSTLEAGVYEMEREELSLGAVVEETIELFRLRAEEKSISLEVHLPDTAVEGEWNEGALNRILENLLENAIKFTPDGGTVEVRVWTENGSAVLEVIDDGIGISAEAVPGIFEAFRQESQGRTREYEGSGLGLSIVQRLTEALGGTVDVDSTKGEGSRFVVRLPRTDDHSGAV